MSSSLIPFQKNILEEISTEDGLLVLARGLGLRLVISNFLRSYCRPSKQHGIVFVVNASAQDEAGINDELGMRMTCIGFEMGSRERENIFKQGGVLSITSRILIVDMLNSKLDFSQIDGIIILHAEEVTPTSIEAFIIRVFRKSNQKGFIKAFSEEPEHFTYGFSPLQTVLGQLKIRAVFLWPRFRLEVKRDLEAKKPKVIELHQPLSAAMAEIQTAIIESMDATLAEIRRSNTNLEVDDLTIDNALHRSFDNIIRTHLNPIWHRVSPKTRQLVSDLTTLRKLLSYLLSFDCVMFYRFLETILFANSSNQTSTSVKQNESPWLFTSAADTIFSVAKNRVYIKTLDDKKSKVQVASNGISSWLEGPNQEEEEAMREAEEAALMAAEVAGYDVSGFNRSANSWSWLPKGTTPVLEDQPKWQLLQEVLKEIEESIWQDEEAIDSNSILIMCSSTSTCSVLKEYLATQHESLDPKFGIRFMMKRRLRNYFFWKGTIGKMSNNLSSKPCVPEISKSTREGFGQSALSKRTSDYQKKASFLNKRRRMRGGISGEISGTSRGDQQIVNKPNDPNAMKKEATEVADLLDSMTSASTFEVKTLAKESSNQDLVVDEFNEDEFAAQFEMLSMDDLVVIRPYLGDEDDRVLEELRPRHIVMYEPDVGFVRRVECYRMRNPQLHVKPYFLMYSDSVEEQKYLSSIRKEKESFERLIRQNSSMVIALEAEVRPGEKNEGELASTISTRLAGGQSLQTAMPKVVVDVREFRSSLPSLLHAANFMVEPTTLMVGDYILSPEMCVERKSISDLIQSFNSGRLYQQCEMMSTHYKQPILLIEFDEKKSFTLETYKDSRGLSTNIYNTLSDSDLQAKLVLLTLSFRKLRLIWSSSPYSTAEIFRELKLTHAEPEAEAASLVGWDDDSKGEKGRLDLLTGGNGVCLPAQEMLKSLPGMDELKARKMIHGGRRAEKNQPQVKNLSELCQLSERDLKNMIGPEAGSRLYRFIHEEVDQKQ
ncbi:hypothetical protein O181_006361 [Austropuccinia psidii MF-1]|uniref:ERCC4 domain-containing protein n=1 Tax=Austropuccinia psidii MF-1 TaxID=1389203 RepID=A0A9Q3GGQ0_9BASI|nr:hypothetical protein [Austropuccinia psidii MF-1]